MFEDISKMEEEVKVFRQNVLASSQLVEGISSLVEETQKQQALMKEVSTDYQNSIQSIADKTIEKIEKLETETIEKLSNDSAKLQMEIADRDAKAVEELKTRVSESLSEAISQISATNKAYVDEMSETEASIKAIQEEITRRDAEVISEMKAKVNENLSEAVDQIAKTNKAYVDELTNTDASIKAMQSELTEKYKQFSSRMDSVKIDEMQKTCSDLKKSVELKTTLAIVGVIVVIVLEIVQLILK